MNGSVYEDLALLLYDIAKGADSFIWNGHSTINSQSQFLCLDTNGLQETSDNMKRTQYFNLLTYCWEKMRKEIFLFSILESGCSDFFSIIF